jgi:hypothetical protein
MSRNRAALARCVALGPIQDQMHARKCSLSPFEILYGRPPPLIPGQAGDKVWEYEQIGLHKFLRGLVHASRELARHLRHPKSPEDWVWVKTPVRGSLDPQWEGPYHVILTTPSALKVAGLRPWIHHTHTRPTEDSGQEWRSRANPE